MREVIQLEQWLMEGAYNKVLAARQNLPAPQFAHLMDLLATTVRCAVQPVCSNCPRLRIWLMDQFWRMLNCVCARAGTKWLAAVKRRTPH